jgi:NADPH:quinone reductase-like Zn-dependent oxidoreductase
MPSNTAAWLTASKAYPLEVKPAPYTPPGEHEIVIKNGAVAINPADWLKQDMGDFMFSWVKYPFVLGTDVAGEVVEIGSAVTRFKVGDRVVGHAVGVDQKRNSSAEGGFQIHTVLLAHMTSAIPSTLSYESASVLPLGVSTAACGLFQKDHLALQYPSVPPKPTGKTLIVWGGSTSVGSNAIQLAVAAGYEVFTTASPKNFDYVKKLGASQVFDYNSKTIVDDLIRALKGKTVAGAYTIGHGAADACMDILPQCKGDKFISMATYPLPKTPPKRFVFLSNVWSFVSWNIANWLKSKTRGVPTKFIFGTTLIDNGVGKAVYADFLPEALAEGSYLAAPDPIVVGKGLEYIQPACDLQKKGVSAKKVVVSL